MCLVNQASVGEWRWWCETWGGAFVLQTNNRGREKRSPHVKEAKKQGKVCDVTEPPRKQQQQQQQQQQKKQKHQNQVLHKDAVTPTVRLHPRPPKPVDEDLYKIPPELLHTSKRVGPPLSLYIYIEKNLYIIRTRLTWANRIIEYFYPAIPLLSLLEIYMLA